MELVAECRSRPLPRPPKKFVTTPVPFSTLQGAKRAFGLGFCNSDQRWRWDLNSGTPGVGLSGCVRLHASPSGLGPVFWPVRAGLSGPIRNSL